MAGQKFLTNNAGVKTEVAAIQTSAGAGDAGKIPGLDSSGRLDSSMMPVGLAAEVDTATTSEAISAGDYVQLYASSGLKARKADASTSGKEATHFALSAVTNGASGTFYRISQSNTQKTGMTPGAKQYLSVTVPGGTQETVPSGTGQLVQLLGVATSATQMVFQPSDPIVLA
jgi:hypothetical protein